MCVAPVCTIRGGPVCYTSNISSSLLSNSGGEFTDATRFNFLTIFDGFGTGFDVEATGADVEATGVDLTTLRAGGRVAEGVAGRFCGKVEVDARGTLCENRQGLALQRG